MTVKRILAILPIIALAAVIVYIANRFLFQGDDDQSARLRELTKGGIVAPTDIETELVRQLKATAPNSQKYREIEEVLRKVRKKKNKTIKETENPGAFVEALALLKTAPDGTTYPKNYKARELAKANRLLDLNRGRLSKIAAVLPWQERGPGNVSGRVQGLVVDISDPSGNTWFAASIGGGVWKTSNAGASWQHKTPQLTVYSTGAVAQSQSNPDVFYVGTGMGYGRIVELVGNGIWKSVDHGETWTQLPSTANGELFEAINRIVVDPNNPDIVLICGNDSFAHFYVKGGERKSGIFRSTDGGASWTQVYDPDVALGTATDNRIQQIIANPQNFRSLYAAVNEVGVIKSTDGGLTWIVSANNFALPADIGNPTGGGIGLAGISVRTELAISPTDTARLYAAVERPRGIADLYMSKDAGASWALVNDTGNDPNWFNSFGMSGAGGAYTAGWFDNTIAVHPFNPDIVFVGGVNIFRLNVNPNTNTRTSTLLAFFLSGFGVPNVHADHHDLKMIPVNPNTGTFRILNANDGGVAISNDGGNTWTQVTGQNSVQFYSVDKKTGEDVYIGGTQDNSTWHSQPNSNASSPWVFDFGGDGAEAVWHATNPNLVIGSQQFGSYLRSTDGANSWSAMPDATAGVSPFISKVASSKIDPDLIFTVGFNGVNRSDDFGESWALTQIQGNWLGYRAFDNVEISLADPKVVWISSRLDIDPATGLRGGVHVSRDGGLTFTEVSVNLPASVTEASGIGTHPFDPATAYLAFSAPGRPKILRTTNFGQTWEDLSGFGTASKITNGGVSSNGFPDVAVFTILAMPFDTNILWVGTEIGLFVSEDGGASWQLSDSGLPTVSVFDMKIVDDEVVVGTYGRGVWSVALPELANYQRPAVTLTPRLRAVFQDFSQAGIVSIPIDLRGAYDRTEVLLNGQVFANLPANATPTDTTLNFMPSNNNPITVSVVSYKNEETLKSAQRNYQPVQIAAAVTSLSLNFNDNSFTNFVANQMALATPPGFANAAVHTPHPYPDQTSLTFTLTQPFILSTGTITYDEIVLVEPGTATDYRDPNFFDYCIVEGSVNGIDWLPLLPGYDARNNQNWLTAYNAGANGTPNLFRARTFNVPAGLFQPQEKVFLRFRLFADPAVNGWGWAIDNLQIQPDVTSVPSENELPNTYTLLQNYPNPFNPSTNITYSLPASAEVTLTIFNVVGQRVRTLVEKAGQLSGSYTVSWDGKNDSGQPVASGNYLYRLEARDSKKQLAFVTSKKMALVK
jgi:hypothetical protein